MSDLNDLDERPLGYYRSAWPCECGGPRRQKVVYTPGPGLSRGEGLSSTVRDTGGWPVMFVQREPGELYLQGGARLAPGEFPPALRSQGDSSGWLERVDPATLEPIHRSPNLPSGGWLWCGAVVVHVNGDLYMVNGRHAYRLGPDCSVRAEAILPVDGPYNGLLVLSDGRLVTRNLGFRDDDVASFALLSADDLRIVGEPLLVPERCMGRWSADRTSEGEYVYFTTAREVRRLRYEDGQLTLDDQWRGSYIVTEGQSDGWDTTIGSGSVWMMDMGRPPGWGAPGTASQRAFRFSIADPSDRDVIDTIGVPSAWNPGPPLYDPTRRILVHYDSVNAVVAAHRYRGAGSMEPLWTRELRNFVQMLVWAHTGELVVEDASEPALGLDAAPAELVLLDIESGDERARAPIGMPATFGMFCCPGFDRDVYVAGLPGAVARVFATA
jgi:hypothetical protein